ncbi:MAG: hypothetical protein NZ908_02060 [Candidatus Micrarchaeota archaeon]|nr:hypothetical protein [Candidatus Micrarchaeota archaeon]MCX8154320.1 hypothetical protein [Candidatus Micrarchaeota archaeon]
MSDFSISKSLFDSNSELRKSLIEMGFNDSEAYILEFRKRDRYKYISDQEYLTIIKDLIREMPGFRKDMNGFLRRLNVKVEDLMRNKYSEFNQASREYMFRYMMEISGNYEMSRRFVDLYRKSGLRLSPYEMVGLVKKIYRSTYTESMFFDRLFRSAAEVLFETDERAKREILFKYQTPPYVIDQVDFDVAVGILKRLVRVDDVEKYKQIRETVLKEIGDRKDMDAYRYMINDIYVDSYSSLSGLIGEFSIVDLVSSILYVASGGKYTYIKYIN